MAKGFKLKQLLSNQKSIDMQKNVSKIKDIEKSDEFHNLGIDSKSLQDENEQGLNKHEQDVATDKPEEYQSNTLSKKEKRKLKKLKNKQEGDDQHKQQIVENVGEPAIKTNEEIYQVDLEKLSKSDTESELEEGDQDQDQEQNDVSLSDVEFDSDTDIIPYQKLTINNSKALNDSLERIQLPWDKHTFQEHQSITYMNVTESSITDIYDDIKRELAFYEQALSAVKDARKKFKTLNVPFKRPLDYYAEMVKSDEHMDRLKSKLVKEASEKKAREDARKQRQLKKFGKEVQVATLQQRQKEKRDVLDRIKNLKKKRKHKEIDDLEFNIGVEEATSEKKSKPNSKRLAKNSKYGQGGLKRFKRKNDAQSSMEISDFSHRKMKGKSIRPGKSKRTRRH